MIQGANNMYYDNNESPGWAIFRLGVLGLMSFLSYQKGKADAYDEIKEVCILSEIDELRNKLKEQNRINELNRLRS
jgi:hypothetical protein